MSALDLSEVRPGLCVFLDPGVLMACAAVKSNARSRANLVNRPGPFLLADYMADDAYLCVPLVSHAGSGRVALDRRLKSGPGQGWLLRDSFFSVHQFWVIPATCIVEASGGEFSPTGQRQLYAEGVPEALAAVANRRSDSDSPYRTLDRLK